MNSPTLDFTLGYGDDAATGDERRPCGGGGAQAMANSCWHAKEYGCDARCPATRSRVGDRGRLRHVVLSLLLLLHP
jgi:hypothetical protein